MSQTVLARAAESCYDVAVGLEHFRDALCEDRENIVIIIAKLHELSTLFTQLDRASRAPQLEPSFFRIRRDLAAIVYSTNFTNRLVLNMFGRTRATSTSRAWEDMNYRMTVTERMPFHRRLELYREGVHACVAVLREQSYPGRRRLNERVIGLLREQHSATGGHPMPMLGDDPPLSPSSHSDSSRHTFPFAPDPPPFSPISTSSRDTFGSGQMSHSDVDMPHWAENIFDGQYPSTSFHREERCSGATRCDAHEMPDALTRLSDEGFTRALEVQFDLIRVFFFFRRQGYRARLLFVDANRRLYCSPLTTLKIVRDKSSLKLCQVLPNGSSIRLRLWANLNFATFERMCLFYSTFVAMKRQDMAGVAHELLIEDDELQEDAHFGGKVRHGDMVHAVRLLRDEGSDVIRIEVSPLRGAYEGVPIWTAFITEYRKRNDLHWAEYERGTVTLSALKPAPYVFLSGYEPPRRGREWLLNFVEKQDAKDFCTAWMQLCRKGR